MTVETGGEAAAPCGRRGPTYTCRATLLTLGGQPLLAHAGHWIGGVAASAVILAVAAAVFFRERRGVDEDD